MTVSATDRLVTENMGLVAMVARRFVGRGTDFEDLLQIGSLGLIKAAKNFDATRNLKFSTYAVAKIVGELKTYFRDNGSIKVSRTLKERATKVRQTEERLFHTLGREATVREIADSMQLRPEDVVECLELKDQVISLDRECEAGGSLADLVGEDTQEKDLDHIILHQALERLEGRERQLIVLRYFLDRTQSETAVSLGISQVSVSRLEKNILKKLGKMIS